MKPTKIRVISHLVVRWTILLAVLAFVTREFYAHVFVSKVHPSVHSLCPMGGLESLLRYITADGATLAKIFSGTMGLFFVSVGISLLFKRAFCGTICPLGTLQAIPGTAGKKIFGAKRFVIPAKLDRWLRLLKYPVLVLTVFMAVATGTLWIQTFDPWAAYSHIFSPAELFGVYAIGFGILVASLIASFFIELAFCKYLCPMGAMTALVGLLSPFKVRRNADSCTSCGLCDRSCPVNIRVSDAKAVTSAECITCGACAAVCPEKDTLSIGWSRKLSINAAAAVALAAGMFFAAIFVLQLTGFDRFSGQQEPTLRELAKSYGTTTAEFKAMYGLPANFFDGNRSGKIEDAIPFAKMAEMNGTDTATIKTALGLGADIADDTPWGTVYGSVRLEKIAEQNGVTVDQFKDRFGLGKNVGPDTPWRDVKKQVLKAAARLQPMESCEHE